MSERSPLRCYDYATVPYERARDALRRDPVGLFQRATNSAAGRAESLMARLHVGVGGLEVGTAVEILIREIKEVPRPLGGHGISVSLGWTALNNAGIFPALEATLTAYPLSATETQLELVGRYLPPFGAVGMALDALGGHRIAEASVLRFLQDVAAQLTREGASAQQTP